MKTLISFLILTVITITALFSNIGPSTPNLDQFLTTKYQQLDKGEFDLPPFDLFELGLIGHFNLKESGKILSKDIITLIDFRVSSNNRRLWIVDLNQNKVMFQTVVSHGKNTGEEFARNFSNTIHSNKSSLGLYITGEKYYGKHGLSLRLDGQEAGFNDNARQRAVVIHGASYATRDFAKAYGRLGRSFGCPAIPKKYHKEMINLISDKSTLFIYYPSTDYLQNSKFLNRERADQYLSKFISKNT
ncbi:MAG: murein L,D-transpeptidase catalytic domain family protein [Bacteroidota bacterium]